MTARDFHTIVVGSGAGGATVADELTRAGRSVVVFERGHNYLVDPQPPHELQRVFSNDELKTPSGIFSGRTLAGAPDVPAERVRRRAPARRGR